MRRVHLIAVIATAFVAGAAVLWLAQRLGADSRADASLPASEAPATGRKVLYWYDPMVPQSRFDAPGKSPFMDMQLVPKYADESGAQDEGTVTIEPRLVQNLGVRTGRATLGTSTRTVRATGVVAFDERAVAVVSAPVAAIVQRLHVRAAFDPVDAGQALFTLLAPDWTAAQEEYLGLRRARAPGLDPLKSAARQRLGLLGMSEGRIRALERRGVSDPRIVVDAPRAGVLGELAVREGASVMPGTMLARINGLDTVWINAAVPEREAAAIGANTAVVATVPALPGRQFEGTVEALLPSVDPATRTLTARVVIENGDRALTPGMFAQLELAPADAVTKRVLVPSEAVIATGTRYVVIVVVGDGRFRAQEVSVGTEAGDKTEILEGLADGDYVVLSGQFLIDSEASLNGALARLQGAVDGADAATRDEPDAAIASDQPASDAELPEQHLAGGIVRRIDGRELTIDTDAIPSLEMGAMSMQFVLSAAQGLPRIAPGDRVTFAFFRNADGAFEIRSIAVIETDTKRPGQTP